MISKQAKSMENILRRMNFRDRTSKMVLHPKRNTRYKFPPKKINRKYSIEQVTIDNRECFSIKNTPNPNKHIIYFHGGAYAIEISRIHWNIVNSILNEIDCMITVVEYPLAPESTCTDAINMVKNAYNHFCKDSNQDIILMGDSAGGGLALALAQVIEEEKLAPAPSKIILFSPWLDISMTDDISAKQAENDLILDVQTLKTAGEKYARKLSVTDPLCSPIYGEVLDIGNVIIFTGTSEILNIQAKKLKEKIENKNGKVIYYEYENMQHVWLGLMIPEAKDAIERACKLINEEV